jgi:hypothetical protein
LLRNITAVVTFVRGIYEVNTDCAKFRVLAVEELSGTYTDYEAFQITKHALVSSVDLFAN